MKKLKKALCLFLALVMCLGMVNFTAFASEGDPAEENPPVVDTTPAEDPPAEENPAEEPPVVEPPAEEPPAEEPPAEEPPVVEPPAEEPVVNTPVYATLDELDAAFAAVGDVDPTGDDMAAFIAAMDNYLAVYSRLSSEDQAARAEEMAYVQAYRDDVAAGQQDEELETLEYESYNTKITLNCGNGTPTGTKMTVGQIWDGEWKVTAISTSSVTFLSKYGNHNNNFEIPAPEDIWEGVSSDYKTVVGYQSFASNSGDLRIGQQAQCLYTGGSGTYKNVINTPSGGGNTPSGPYITVVHKYYTNGTLDDTVTEEKVTVDGYYAWPSDHYKPTYNGNTYPSKSSDKTFISISGTGYQGTLTLTYKRTVAEKVTLTYMDRGNQYRKDTYDKGDTATVVDCTNTRNGYTFQGWDTDSSADNVVYEAGNTFTINENMTLYAVWQKNGPTDNGNGISITKTRASINGEANLTTAEPGDEIEWNITVTNLSNVEKTVTLTEKLEGATLSKSEVTLEAGKSETVTATYTVKAKDVGKTLYNTVVGTTGGTGEKENPEAKDNGTTVPGNDPGTTKGNFTVKKSFVGLEDDVEAPDVTLTYNAYRTKDGSTVGTPETGKVTLTKQTDGTYQGTITPTIWDDKALGNMAEAERLHYKNMVEISEDLSTAMVENYTHDTFSAVFSADGSNVDSDTVKFVIPGASSGKTLSVKNTYTKNPVEEPDPTIDDLDITKAADKEAPKLGDEVGYTITVINNAAKAATVTVTDDLADGKLALKGGSKISVKIGETTTEQDAFGFEIAIPAGGSATITYTAEVKGTGEVKNTATVKLGEAEKTANETVTVPSTGKPILLVTKTADRTKAYPGGPVSYTIKVENLGSVDATGVTVTDGLPAGLEYVDSTITLGADSKYTLGTIKAGEAAELTIEARVKADTAADDIRNVASATCDEGASDNDVATITVMAKDALTPKIKITKTNDGLKLNEAKTAAVVNYTVTIQNLSGFPIYGLLLTDVMTPTVEKIDAETVGEPSVTYTFSNWMVKRSAGAEADSITPISTTNDGLTNQLGLLARNTEFPDGDVVTLTYTVEVKETTALGVKVKLHNIATANSWSYEYQATPDPEPVAAARMANDKVTIFTVNRAGGNVDGYPDIDQSDVQESSSSSTGGSDGDLTDDSSSETEITIPKPEEPKPEKPKPEEPKPEEPKPEEPKPEEPKPEEPKPEEPPVIIPEEDPPLVDLPDEPTPEEPAPEEPVVDVPDEQPPLVDLPDEQPPLVDWPDQQPPLTDLPVEWPPIVVADDPVPATDIPDEDVPLANVPQTGDYSLAWCVAAVVSVMGLAVLTLKKREDEEI